MRPTLYEYAGGAPAILALARAHHERCLADPELSHPFTHGDIQPDHVERLAAYWGEVFGGPPVYTERFGDESGVLLMHAGNGPMDDLGDRFVACFVAALDDAELPADREFRRALHDYMRWAVDNVLLYAPVGSAVPPDRAMPRWEWSTARR